MAAGEQKTTTDKANFSSNTVFSLYFKIRAKKFHAAKPLAAKLPQNFWWNLHLETTKALKALHRDLLHGLHQLIVFLRTKSRMAERKFDQARDGRKILILKDHFVSLSQDKLNQI